MIIVEGENVYNIIETETSFEKYLINSRTNIKLEASKKTILSDGKDMVVVTAKLFDYENYFILEDKMISFMIASEKVEVEMKKGIASIELTSNRIGIIQVWVLCGDSKGGMIEIESV